MPRPLMIELPDMRKAKRILAIQPHYDDNDIGAGGTLHLLARQGVEIIYLTVTDDLAGVVDPDLDRASALELLHANQQAAGKVIGVNQYIHLGLPDAGAYDYFLLRDQLIGYIREVHPDFIFTVDPWTPYEAHHDHIMTGKASAEAAILYSLPHLGERSSANQVNFALQGVVFYNSAYPNKVWDITQAIKAKQQAISAYTAQFNTADLKELIEKITFLADFVAREEDFAFGEALKIVPPWMLHGVPLTKDF